MKEPKVNLPRLFRLLSQKQLLRLLNLIPKGQTVSATFLSNATGLTLCAVIRQLSEARKCGMIVMTNDATDWYFTLPPQSRSLSSIILADLERLFEHDPQFCRERDRIREALSRIPNS